jgi:signal transduction protein with GAF and PtsI domain
LRNQIAKACGVKAGFGVPILANHQVLVVLVFFMSAAREEDRRLVKLMTAVATQLGTVLQRSNAVKAS